MLALVSKSLAIPNSKATHYRLLSSELSARKAPALCLKQFSSLSDYSLYFHELSKAPHVDDIQMASIVMRTDYI